MQSFVRKLRTAGNAALPSLGRATRLLALSLAGLAVFACSDKSRRMGEKETLDYKRELVAEHHGSLSEAQRMELMMHPARTRGELDAALEKYVADSEERRERDRVRLLREREAARGIVEEPDGASMIRP